MEPCKECHKQIPSCYFLKELSLCMCCLEVLRGGMKKCETCRETVNITKFERPYLLRCKSCINLRLYKKIKCKQCPTFILLSNMNKHTLSHPPKCSNIKTKNSLETIMSDYEDDD